MARSGSLPLANSRKKGWFLVCHFSRMAMIFFAMADMLFPQMDEAQLALRQVRNDDGHAAVGAGNDAEVGRTLEAGGEILLAGLLAPAEERPRVPVGRKQRTVLQLVEAVEPADRLGERLDLAAH